MTLAMSLYPITFWLLMSFLCVVLWLAQLRTLACREDISSRSVWFIFLMFEFPRIWRGWEHKNKIRNLKKNIYMSFISFDPIIVTMVSCGGCVFLMRVPEVAVPCIPDSVL